MDGAKSRPFFEGVQGRIIIFSNLRLCAFAFLQSGKAWCFAALLVNKQKERIQQ
jgi:hypothetical protein